MILSLTSLVFCCCREFQIRAAVEHNPLSRWIPYGTDIPILRPLAVDEGDRCQPPSMLVAFKTSISNSLGMTVLPALREINRFQSENKKHREHESNLADHHRTERWTRGEYDTAALVIFRYRTNWRKSQINFQASRCTTTNALTVFTGRKPLYLIKGWVIQVRPTWVVQGT